MGVGALEQFEFFFQFRRLHLLQIFFQALETFFDLAEIADHEIELDVLDVAQGIDLRHERNRGIFENADHVGERVDLTQMADVGGLFQRVLADSADVDVFDGGVGQFLGVVERGQTVEAVVGNFGDADVRFARIR